MRAKARCSRWKEEHIRIPWEMEFVVRDFLYKYRQWLARKMVAEGDGKLGHACYAAKQARMWKKMADDALIKFKKLHASLSV